MKFTVLKQDIWKAMQAAIGIIPTKSTLPILSNALFQNTRDTLSISATDLDVSIITHIPVQAQEEGSITLPAKKVAEIIRELPDGPIDFQLEKQQIQITTSSGVYKILGLNKDEFPDLPQKMEGMEIKMDGSRLQRMMEKTIFAVSTDETRPALNGVLWQIKKNEMRMIATDGHRLAKIVHAKVKTNGHEKDIIIPIKALHCLNRFRSEMAELKSVIIGDNYILFELGKTLIFARLIAETYPNYERVIPQNNEKRLIVNKNMFASSVKRVAILSNSITHQIRLSLNANNLEVSTLDQEIGGEAKENITGSYTGEAMEIGYNAQYMLEIVAQIESEEVVFELNNPTTAGLVHATVNKENEDYVCLIMPLRLND